MRYPGHCLSPYTSKRSYSRVALVIGILFPEMQKWTLKDEHQPRASCPRLYGLI